MIGTALFEANREALFPEGINRDYRFILTKRPKTSEHASHEFVVASLSASASQKHQHTKVRLHCITAAGEGKDPTAPPIGA